jgi:hypothetical protein
VRRLSKRRFLYDYLMLLIALEDVIELSLMLHFLSPITKVLQKEPVSLNVVEI